MDHEEALIVLGLRGPADRGAVKHAYRDLARRLHPDAGGDADRFHRVRIAYELLREGTKATVGPPPQERSAGVDERWWDAAGAWHDEHVDRTGVDLARARPDVAAAAMDLDLLASLLHGRTPLATVRLHSRAPGSWLHHLIGLLEPDLLAQTLVAPAKDGPRPGHDVDVSIRSTGGRGRRLLAATSPPSGWTRSHGAESVTLRRRFRPCRDPADTAVRIAGELADALDEVGWSLGEWFILRG